MSEILSTKTHPLSLENVDEKRETYTPAEKEQKVVSDVINKFRLAQSDRDRQFNYFDGRTLIDVINDSVGRFITNIDERDGIEDWQARVHVPMTHSKVQTVLGKVIAQLPVAEVVARFDDDTVKANILSDLYQFSEDADGYDELILCAVLEAVVKGTVIGYEGYEYKQRKVRDVLSYDSNGLPKMREATISESKLFGSIVPLEEFYPSSVSIRKIDDMPYCFRRYQIPYANFVQSFSMFERHALVSPKSSDTTENQPFYKDYISTGVDDGNVEIIFYFNKDTDEYVCVANGIWLNPLSDFTVAPNPFSHKKLPFWSARFDTLGVDFFYGKSLVDRMSALQDVMNVLINMALDQSFLTIFPPILTAGIDPIEEDYMRPGRRIPVDTQGLPLNQSFMKLDLGTPSGWHQWIIEYSKNILEEASVDQTSSGQAGVGGRTTAEEIRTAAAGVAAILGVFGKLLNQGIKTKAYLRVANILQFWTDKNSPMISTVLGSKAGMFAEAFNVISVDNAKLSNGKRGKKVIAMYDGNEALPTPAQVKTTAQLGKLRTGQEVEIQAITGDYIRGVQYDIKLVPNVKTNETKEVQKALTLEKARVYMSFPPIAQRLNMDELLLQLANAFGDDASKMFNPAQPPAPPAPADGANPQAAQTEPQGDVANNMVRKMMGGEADSMAFRDM